MGEGVCLGTGCGVRWESTIESEQFQQLREGNQEVATAKEKEHGKEIGRETRWCPNRKASRNNCFKKEGGVKSTK